MIAFTERLSVRSYRQMFAVDRRARIVGQAAMDLRDITRDVDALPASTKWS